MNETNAPDGATAPLPGSVDSRTPKQQRLPKFHRQPAALPLILQPRDEDIIRAAAKSRFLRTHHIQALIPGGEQGIFRRLQKLFHAGFLARVYDPEEVRVYREQRLGTPKAIYALDNEGAKLLFEKYHYPIHRQRWDLKNRRIAPQNIQHQLIITNFLLTLTLALKTRPHLQPLPVADSLRRAFAKEETWQDPYPWCYTGRWIKASVSISEDSRTRKGSFYPDGLFALEDSTREPGRSRAFFFLEADNQTLTIQKRMRPKLLAHWGYFEQARQGASHLQLPSGFRILHVSRGKGRRDNLLKLARELYNARLIGGSLHWFATEEDYSLEKPESLFAPIWYIPGHERLHSILE